MDFNLGDIAYSIENRDLGLIAKVEVVHIDDIYIEFWGDAVEGVGMRIDEYDEWLYKTYDAAANYLESLGKSPKLISII